MATVDDELEALRGMLDNGVIDSSEYERMRQTTIDRHGATPDSNATGFAEPTGTATAKGPFAGSIGWQAAGQQGPQGAPFAGYVKR